MNDAPALAAGDIGIAMGAAGSEVAIHSATIALMNNDLRRLPFLVKLSRSTRTVINQNFLFGVAFIIGGMTLSALSYVPPVMAAAMHTGGSLIVVFNSARLVRKGEELGWFEHGSTIIVLAGEQYRFCDDVGEGKRIRAGQPLLRAASS